MQKITRRGCLIILATIPIVIILWITALIIISPIRRPQSSVRKHILRLTPLGTNIEDVIDFIENRDGWQIHIVNYEQGFPHPQPHLIRGWDGQPIVVGEQGIRVRMGYYHAWYKLNFRTDVSIFWGFDADGYLIDVWVWKSIG